MGSVEVLASEVVRETVHGEHEVELLQQRLRIPAADGEPPLAVERSTLASGASRERVVLVHGFAQNRYTWRISRRSLQARLAEEGYDVWNLELRGHGLSRAYGAGNARAFEEYASDVVRAVGASESQAFLVGHSLGAAACAAAVSRVSTAGLVNIAGVYTFAQRNRTLRALAKLSLAWEPMLTMAPVRMSTGWAGTLIGQLYSISDIAGYIFPISGWTPDSIERDLLEERLAHGFDWTSVEVWLEMCRWAGGHKPEWAHRFEGTDVPLLVLMGDHDVLAKPVDGQSCYDASGSSDREIVVLDAWENERHWGHLDLILGHVAPREAWPRIVDWLNARSGG